MVCGRGASIGKKLKQNLTSDYMKKVVKVVDPFKWHLSNVQKSLDYRGDQPVATEEQIGFTEEDKKNLRRRQGLGSTRLTTGLLSKGVKAQASILGGI